MPLVADVFLYLAAILLWLRHRTLVLDARLRRVVRRVHRFATTLVHLGFPRPPPPRAWCRGGHNRTLLAVEESVCRLHVERPDLGLRGLRAMMIRLEGVTISPSTVRAILLRSEDRLAALLAGRKKVPRTIRVRRALKLWDLDFGTCQRE